MSEINTKSGYASSRNTMRVVERDAATLCLQFEGAWSIQHDSADAAGVVQRLQDEKISAVLFDGRELAGWDSSLITMLLKVLNLCRQRKIKADTSGLPSGVQAALIISA